MKHPVIKEGAPDILSKIVQLKRQEVERLKFEQPLAGVRQRMESQHPPLNVAATLREGPIAVIAEVKKASPTKGLLAVHFDPCKLAITYVECGASAISVLTEADHFLGSIEHLETVRTIGYSRGVPVLRKDFIFDDYQVYESRAYGADFILLIVALLETDHLKQLQNLANSLGLQCLVEVHDEQELDIALEVGASLVGINNRDLRTFETSLETTERLAPLIPTDRTVVGESGIHTREHMKRMEACGAHAALIGESLVTAVNPGLKLQEMLGSVS